MTGPQAARPIHVAHVVHRFAVGGMENGVANLVNRLDPDRFRHSIVAMTDITEFRSRITAGNVQLLALGKRPGNDPRAYWRLMRWLRAARPAIIHTRNIGTLDTVFVSRVAGVPVRVHGEHGWDMHDLHGDSRKYRLLRQLCAPMVGRFVTVSADLASWLQETVGIPGERITHIVNGVDCDRFRPGDARALRRSLFPTAGPSEVIVGSVGRFERVKGQELLLRAWPAVESLAGRGGRAVRLLLVGDGSERPRLESLARELGVAPKIVFAGPRSDVPELLRAMDVFVLPSLNEGISNTILEAMATGLPVVATRVGGNPELVTEGVTGLLVGVARPDELAEALARLASDDALRERMSRAARETAVERFSVDRMVSSYASMYEQAVRAGTEAGA